jgi:hypothetical protein
MKIAVHITLSHYWRYTKLGLKWCLWSDFKNISVSYMIKIKEFCLRFALVTGRRTCMYVNSCNKQRRNKRYFPVAKSHNDLERRNLTYFSKTILFSVYQINCIFYLLEIILIRTDSDHLNFECCLTSSLLVTQPAAVRAIQIPTPWSREAFLKCYQSLS